MPSKRATATMIGSALSLLLAGAVSTAHAQFDREYCFLPPDSGPCECYWPRYYYNATTGCCEEFIYGCCEGNENNFLTLAECEAACVSTGQTRTWGSATLADFAVFQRCYGLTGTDSQCDEEDFDRSDIYPDGAVDLFDYHYLQEGFEPGPWHANCSFPPCGPDCLPRGQDVDTHTSTWVWVNCALSLGDADRVQVVQDQKSLDLLMPSDAQALLGMIDFDVSEVIVFSTNQYVWGTCWASQCYVGVVDLADGRRALVVSGVPDKGRLICLIFESIDIRAVVVPRSDRPVSMFLVPGGNFSRVREVNAPLCPAAP